MGRIKSLLYIKVQNQWKYNKELDEKQAKEHITLQDVSQLTKLAKDIKSN